MPWGIYQDEEKFCVHKKNPDGSKGENAGCSGTEVEAKKHLAALYANAKEKMRVEDMNITKAKPFPPPKPPKRPPEEPPLPPDEDAPTEYPYRKPNKIQDVINKIIGTNGRRGQDPPPNGKKPDMINPTAKRIPPVQKITPVPSKREDKKPPKKIYKELEGKSILFTKEGDRMRWLCDYSNNFRDRDNPPEILASAAHERFVKEVDNCEFPMPELWWWHMDGTRLGQADWLGYDKETGIPLASGYIDKGMEPVADAIAHYPENVGVSHGMIIPLLERDSKDKSIITRYVSREISALPARAAANTLPEFLIGKETHMALTKDKIESLKTLGYSDEQIADVEARNKAKSEEAKAAGIESKETEVPVVPEEKPAEVVEPVVEVPAEPVVETPTPIEEKPVTQAELKETVEALVKGFAEVVKPLQAEINTQHKMIEGMVTKAREDAKKEMSMTPASSVGALFAKQFSAIGKEATLTSGRESLAKSGPKEAQAENGLPSFITHIISPEQ
jgi:hypothetical protein